MKPCGVIAAEIVGRFFWRMGKKPTQRDHMLCLAITEALSAERRGRSEAKLKAIRARRDTKLSS